jgi:hypothetical protein
MSENETFEYLFVRMWAPHEECNDPTNAHYVQSIPTDSGGLQWTVTRVFTEAHVFKSLRTANRVVHNVRRIAGRIQRGWIYEIIEVKEEIVESNVPEDQKKKKKEEAA